MCVRACVRVCVCEYDPIKHFTCTFLFHGFRNLLLCFKLFICICGGWGYLFICWGCLLITLTVIQKLPIIRVFHILKKDVK